jgi:hypothetical protein
MKLCMIGIHKWGKAKQWIADTGKAILSPKCKRCGKIKGGK